MGEFRSVFGGHPGYIEKIQRIAQYGQDTTVERVLLLITLGYQY
jgi:hypothetical protein